LRFVNYKRIYDKYTMFVVISSQHTLKFRTTRNRTPKGTIHMKDVTKVALKNWTILGSQKIIWGGDNLLGSVRIPRTHPFIVWPKEVVTLTSRVNKVINTVSHGDKWWCFLTLRNEFRVATVLLPPISELFYFTKYSLPVPHLSMWRPSLGRIIIRGPTHPQML